ncbi:DUF4388 domain-containing protein [Chitinispirillales bacterium ANBcel5]|uniref:DUF4388 domain-containing protein n=1 Tax=Cellulosispirillum alkaliphilum TaxID=3039283 RepID=UPI002A54D65D|nr:DUF4388 domain-containing protein [Chitinispirillales bacterium ANBcel5]
MVLSGSIREFILADVFQLLSQQKITGKLILTKGKDIGFVLFDSGMVIGAKIGEENLERKLYNYLTDVQQNSPISIQELISSHQGDLNSLCEEIVEKKLAPPDDLQMFIETSLEDLVCSLFYWKSGSYKFNSMNNAEHLIIRGIKVPTENIIMEAMRRVDEWNRITEIIDEDTVFIPNEKELQKTAETDIFNRPEDYIYNHLDSTHTLRTIINSCCLCEFKVYEAINILLQTNRISALSPRISRSIQAAMEKKNSTPILSYVRIAVSLIVAAIITFAALFSGNFLRTTFLLDSHEAKKQIKNYTCIYAEEKIISAEFFYQTTTGKQIDSMLILKEMNILSNPDFRHCKH